MAERFLTVRDVSLVLGISEKEVMDLVESKQLEAYKVGGVYIRFKQEQIEQFKKSFKPPTKNRPIVSQQYSLADRISDFFYFNDFYIASFIIIAVLMFLILRS